MIQWPLDAPGSSELSHWFGLAGREGGDSDALLCSFDISERILHVALQAWEHSVGIDPLKSLLHLIKVAQEFFSSHYGNPPGAQKSFWVKEYFPQLLHL